MDAARRTSMRIREVKSASGVPPMPQRKTPAQASKEYRKRLKQDPEAYEFHRKHENIRIKLFMDQLDEEKRAQYRAKTRLRVQKYRAKQKAEGLAKPPVKAITRAAKEKQQAKWKEDKRRHLANETPEARDRRNARRRELYAMKSQPQGKNVRNDPPPPTGPSPTDGDTEPTPSVSALSSSSSGYKTKAALRQAACRARKALPKDSIKAAEVIEKLVANATPTKKKALKSKMFLSPNSKKRLDFHSDVVTGLAETLKRLKKKRSKEDNRTRITLALALKRKSKYLSTSQRSDLGIGYRLADKVQKGTDPFQRKVRKDAVSASTVALVEEFYRRADFSRQLPDARGTKRCQNGEIVARRVMERSVAAIHEAFKSEHPECTVGKSLFAALRPDDVLPTTSCRKRDCLCEYCANIDLKLEALRVFATKKGLTCTFKDRYEVLRSTLCPKGESGQYQRECLDRQCNSCGTTAIDNHLRPLLESHMQETITYKKWTHVLRNGKKRLMRIKRTTLIPDFVDEMVSDMAPFSKHLFDAYWQGRQYEHVSRCPEKDTVVICEDYAENYKTEYQDEAQGAHWNYEQVTLHASVASYKCQQADCNLTVTESVVFVSDDPKHDAHAIQHFHHMLMTHLQGQDRPPFKKAIFFSDGAPGQYKNKTSFMDLSCAEQDFGITAERHFFGTRHGKGPCDREFGTLKGSIGRHIKMRGVEIDSAETFFDFVEEKYSRPAPPRGEENHCHFQRKFFFVKKENVQRERQHMENLKPIPNTRQQHSIRQISRGVVAFRERSCFCEVCLGKEQGECPSHSLTGDWNVFSLLKGQRVRTQMNGDPTAVDQGDPTAADQDQGGTPAADQTDPIAADQDQGGTPAADQTDPTAADQDQGGTPAADQADPTAADHESVGIPVTQLLDQGGVPTDQGGVPTDQGGVPTDQGGVPTDQGGVPTDQGGVPTDQGGVPTDQGGTRAPEQLAGISHIAPGVFLRALVLPESGIRAKGKVYVAVVRKVLEDGKLIVAYLRTDDAGKGYSYPDNDAEFPLSRSDTEEVLPEPRFDRRGGRMFFE